MEALQQAYAICAELVKKHDADRATAALFAPADRRPSLYALQAFSLEIAGIRGQIKEALPGEIRLQWWRDALGGERAEEAKAHPVALAILDTIQSNRLPLQALLDLIDARVFDLYDDQPADWNTLEGYCGETSSALFRLASIILMRGEEPGAAEAAGHAGVAYAITGLLRAFPWHARRGQVFMPQSLTSAVGLSREDIVAGKDSEALRAALSEMRGQARGHLEKVDALRDTIRSEIKPAFLPLANVKAYLAEMERKDYAPYSALVDVPQWKRVWSMWRW
ncbi:MAG: phytoene/squalene synthase family protein [Beijerinckiaceae bacterium]